MKAETLIYEKVRNIIPNGSEKTIFFAAIDETSYEIFFYAFIGGKAYQCFELAEQDILDENELDTVFSEIVRIIKESKIYSSDKKNIATIKIDKSGVKLDMVYADQEERLYWLKKKWEKEHIQ